MRGMGPYGPIAITVPMDAEGFKLVPDWFVRWVATSPRDADALHVANTPAAIREAAEARVTARFEKLRAQWRRPVTGN